MHIWQSREKDGFKLMVMIGQKDELIPMVRLGAILKKLAERCPLVACPQQLLFEVRDPVRLGGTAQNIGGCQDNVVVDDVKNGRTEPHVAEFAFDAQVARGDMTGE